ncbi:Stage II sporulation protein E (SpoIIE) [Lachnospiraceae bacterium XBB1006]|nr:Stage II sporulation protein E (SpoIIE) [Lachnospiraceae bacterium XBB1006]
MRKKQIVCYMGVLGITAVRLMGANPFFPGVIGIMGCENVAAPLLMISYGIGLSLFVPYLMGIKYFLIGTCILVGEGLVKRKRRSVSTPFATLIVGISVFAVGLSGEAFSLSRYGVMVVALESTFGMSMVLCFKQLFHECMVEKKKLFVHTRATEFKPRGRLMGCVRAVEKLSHTLESVQEARTQAIVTPEGESAIVVQNGLKALADTLTDCLQEKEYACPNKEMEICHLEYALSEKGIESWQYCYLEDEQGRGELTFWVRVGKKQKVPCALLAKMAKEAFGVGFFVKEPVGAYLPQGEHMVCLAQRGRFQVRYFVTGVSGEKGEPCGDNFSVVRSEQGKTTLMLSDGMGRGQKACRQSESVLELIEELLEAGFETKDALTMTNGCLASKNDEGFTATVDVCEFDGFTGEALFYKMGATSSFLIRKNQVEELTKGGLPVGAFVQTEITPLRRKLYDGDYLVMVSDGVLDALADGEPEETFRQVLRVIPKGNPGAMADRIMKIVNETKGRNTDDCMVLVAGIWER